MNSSKVNFSLAISLHNAFIYLVYLHYKYNGNMLSVKTLSLLLNIYIYYKHARFKKNSVFTNTMSCNE